MIYTPHPIDTSDVILSRQLEELTEQLARNVHENWARERLSDGWVYGPERNDRMKTSPCLIPYDQLPERERDYDRHTAMETVRLILKLGYTITCPKEG